MADWKENPESLVGKRITVLWAKGKKYSGVVEGLACNGTHAVLYDDGQIRHYDMKTKAFWVEGLEFRPNVWNAEIQSVLKAENAQQIFKGACFVLSGGLWNLQSEVKDVITLHGGKVESSFTNPVTPITHVIAKDGKSFNNKDRSAFEDNIPIVTEDYLLESIFAGKLLKSPTGKVPAQFLCGAKMMKLHVDKEKSMGQVEQLILKSSSSPSTKSKLSLLQRQPYSPIEITAIPSTQHTQMYKNLLEIGDKVVSMEDQVALSLEFVQNTLDNSNCFSILRKGPSHLNFTKEKAWTTKQIKFEIDFGTARQFGVTCISRPYMRTKLDQHRTFHFDDGDAGDVLLSMNRKVFCLAQEAKSFIEHDNHQNKVALKYMHTDYDNFKKTSRTTMKEAVVSVEDLDFNWDSMYSNFRTNAIFVSKVYFETPQLFPLQVGDKILSINDKAITTLEKLEEIIKKSESPLSFNVSRILKDSEVFQVGDWVEALWKGSWGDKSFTGQISEINGDGTYYVECDNGGSRKVQAKNMRLLGVETPEQTEEQSTAEKQQLSSSSTNRNDTDGIKDNREMDALQNDLDDLCQQNKKLKAVIEKLESEKNKAQEFYDKLQEANKDKQHFLEEMAKKDAKCKQLLEEIAKKEEHKHHATSSEEAQNVQQLRAEIQELQTKNISLQRQNKKLQETYAQKDQLKLLEEEIETMKEFLKTRKLEEDFNAHLIKQNTVVESFTVDIPNQLNFPLEFEESKNQLILRTTADFKPEECKSTLKKGDILLKVNQLKVTSLPMLKMALEMLAEAPTLSLDFERQYIKRKEINLKRTRQQERKVLEVNIKNQQPLGIVVAKGINKVQIQSFSKEATDEMKSLLKIGDVICTINDLKVNSPEAFDMATAMLSSFDIIKLKVERISSTVQTSSPEEKKNKISRIDCNEDLQVVEIQLQNQQPLGLAVNSVNDKLEIKDFGKEATLEMKSKLKIGDQICQINGMKVTSQPMLKMVMEMLSSQDILKITVERKSEQVLGASNDQAIFGPS